MKLTCSRDDLMWLVGILEGEGCFTMRHRYPINSRPLEKNYRSAVVRVVMTDRDIIDRVQSIIGGSISSKDRENNWKTRYEVCLADSKAISVMEDVLPYMGLRRSERIREILEVCREDRIRSGLHDVTKAGWKHSPESRAKMSVSQVKRFSKSKGI